MEEKLWHKSYAEGVPWSIDYEKLTVSEGLARSAKEFPDQVAISYMGKKITYRQLDAMVNRFARALMDLGIGEGDKVATIMPNIPQMIIANMAAFRIGAVVVLNNPLYTERELQYQLDDSDSKIAITLTLLVPRIEKIMPNTKVEKVIGCQISTYLPFPKKQLFPYVRKEMYKKIEPTDKVLRFEDLISKYSPDRVEDKGKWDELSTIIYTGGTTGLSKGVMLSHKNISVNVQQFAAWFPDLDRGGISLVGTFPVFHAAGFTAVQNFFIWQAWEHCMIPRPEPKGVLEILKKDKPDYLPGVPTIFVGLLADPEFRKMDLSFIKGFFSGAAPLAADTIRDLKELTGATILEVYGQSETTPIATVTPWGGTIKPGTVGIPVSDTDIKIVDLDTGTKELPQGEVGEIIIYGPQNMMGYYKKPQETAEALRDGWIYTSDIGFFDEDGYLTVVDRKKDMIIAGGYNIYPLEIDNVLFDHPKILEACAVGDCRENLAAYKIPKNIEFVSELPKSTVGKILRRELRDQELKKTET